MSFFSASKKKEDLKQGGGTAYINRSGCFPVNILAAFVSTSDKGSNVVDFFVEHEGQKQVVYGNLRITNNNGESNQIGMKTFNQLVIIADLENVADPVEMELPIGKDGALVDCAVLEDLSDIEVLMRVQMEYTVYNGSIIEKKNIRAFFRADDNASAEEIVNEEGFGTQFEKETKYFDNVTYKDGLDEETVAKWIADGRPKDTAGNSTTSKTASSAPKFGKKKTFGSK